MKCSLCPRNCPADRKNGQTGFCRCGALPAVRRCAPHMWEEPCICGPGGSGTIFFGGCNMRCVYCQNSAISRDGTAGRKFNSDELAGLFISLQEQGVSNINLVTPTPWTDIIRASLDEAWSRGLYLPVLYNTGGYDSVESLKKLRGYISVYLPDYKYGSDRLAVKYSSAPGYPEAALAAINEMIAQTGAASFDSDGIMKKGVIIRHLVLPGLADESVRTLEKLYNGLDEPEKAILSVMSQYTPQPGVPDEINRTVTAREYDTVCDAAFSLGFYGIYTQDGSSASESFIPEWDTGPCVPAL